MNPNLPAAMAARATELLNPGPAQDVEPKLLDLEDDTPLAPACDLSGEGACESCQ